MRKTAWQRRFSSLRFTKDHQWVQSVDGDDRTIRLGLSRFGQESLGSLVFVQLPHVHDLVRRHDCIGAVESAKGAADIYAPCDGKVVAVNKMIIDNPALIGKSSQDQGTTFWMFANCAVDWLCEIEPASSLEDVMTFEQYDQYCKTGAVN